MDRDCAGTRLISDFMLMADQTVNLPNDLPGGATPQAATMDDVFGTKLADSDSPGDTLAEYAYLGLGRIVQEIYPEPEVRLDYDSGTPGDYAGFDRFDRVVDHRWYAYGASADRDRYTYGYDRASNRLYRENTLTTGRDELYRYDQVNRLVEFARGELNATKDGITGTATNEEDWALDMTGNWPGLVQKTSGSTDLDQGRTHNPVNEITAITATTGTNWADPEHDRAGNMTTIPKPASLADGLTATYDAWNRLVEVKDGATVIARYEYDGLNRRIKSHIDSGAPSNPTGIDTYVHYYHNSAWQILETRETDTQSAQPETVQPKHQYVWSRRYIDAAVLRDENTGANGLCDDQRLYYLNDANFNVTALLDTDGHAVERYLYSPYGVLTIYDPTWTNARSASSYGNVTLYTGRELDAETGLYYYRNRYYSAEVGRFCSRDLIGYQGRQWNQFEYVLSRPLLYTDPLGMVFWYPRPSPPAPPPPAPPGLPGEIDNLWPLEHPECVGCSRQGLENILQAIQEEIDNTSVFFFWPGHCQRWVFAFEKNLPDTLSFSPCIKEAQVGWESSPFLGGGHAFYHFTLCDGTTIRGDNGYTTGPDNYKIIPANGE
jgi:RHS repeat-associated protein